MCRSFLELLTGKATKSERISSLSHIPIHLTNSCDKERTLNHPEEGHRENSKTTPRLVVLNLPIATALHYSSSRCGDPQT